MSVTRYIKGDGVPPLPAGEWAWMLEETGDREPAWLVFGCPCALANGKGEGGCGGGLVHNSYIAVSREEKGLEHCWTWDGDWDKPTLTPSIQRHGACEWHGHLQNGVFVTA